MKVKKRIKLRINRKGFSLIELTVTLGILSLIIIGLVTFFSGGTRSWVTGQYQLEAQRNARLAMDRMVKEIREADSINDSSTLYRISFHTPFDGDIIYNYNSGDKAIYRQKNENSSILIDNVLVFEVIYWNSSEVEKTPSSESDEISKLHIELKVDVDKDSNPDITLNTDVNLRNFGL
jgi:prepilin-type N-terminal cleavage/methylation domain-containing protein